MAGDRSIQLVNYNKEDKTYTFNKKALQQIIEENGVQDLPVSVISVAGLFRKGKSFLLNFFLRYLYAGDRENWLSESDESLKGFEWKGGRKRNTEGIHIWSKIFKLPTADGSQVAVMLMDTQGTFDGKSSNKTGTAIFALSALVSSVQVYNLSQQISEDDLENLLWFTQNASSVQGETDQKAFQSLIFLVRDWHHFIDYPYGKKGGKKLLDQVLQVTPDQEPSLTKVRNDIRSTYEKLSCFLLPYPGKTVATDMNFNGNIRGIDDTFITHIRAFIPSVLSPGNLTLKNVNDLELTSNEFVELFATYLKYYNSDELPDEVSKAEAAAEAYYAPLLERCVNIYKMEMMKMLDDYQCRIEDCTSQVFIEAHENIRAKAENKFNKSKRFSKDFASRKSDILTARIQESFELFKGKRSRRYKVDAAKHYNALGNGIAKEYNNKMIAILDKSEDEIELYTATAYANTHTQNKTMAVEKFCKEKRFGEYDAIDLLEKMKQEIETLFEINENRRKHKFDSAVTRYYNHFLEKFLGEYNAKMRRLMDEIQLVMNSFVRMHENNKSDAINQFNKTKSYSKDIQSNYSKKLLTNIEASFVLFQEQRLRKLECEKEMIKSEKELKLSELEREQKIKELKLKYDAEAFKITEKLKSEEERRKSELEVKKLELETEEKRLKAEMEKAQIKSENEMKKENSRIELELARLKSEEEKTRNQTNVDLEKLRLDKKTANTRLEKEDNALKRELDAQNQKRISESQIKKMEIEKAREQVEYERKPWYMKLFG